jgi:deoxyribodipyrimidine photo-lyase
MMDNKLAPIILWFRNDLRLTDHPALNAAIKTGRPLIALYIYTEDVAGQLSLGSASRWWLHHSLLSLKRSVEKLGGRLCLQRGNPLTLLPSLIAETHAEAVYFSRAYEPWARAQENDLHRQLADKIELRRFAGSLLLEPEQVQSARGLPIKVFTPFWKACLKQPHPQNILPIPQDINFYQSEIASEILDEWRLLPSKPDWSLGFQETWEPGESNATKAMVDFVETALKDYKVGRDRPALMATSWLSAHLHFGEISPRIIWHTINRVLAEQGIAIDAAECFLRELGWREFCHHLLFHWPEITEHPFRREFEDFPWHNNPEFIKAWQQGKTGYPLVDAGMRQLWRTGWMHNRVRMVAASFLVKDLLQPWQAGAAWFWDTLVDADLANNTCGWQWVAGCGADAAPYFRIFNPTLQGVKFDPQGEYVKRWLPELALLPVKFIHEPWKAPADVLQQAGIELGKDYPYPLVEHGEARAAALEALQYMKNIKAAKELYSSKMNTPMMT